MINKSAFVVLLFSTCLLLPICALAVDDNIELSKGQRIYVPAYSHIYSGNKEKPFLLTVTLSIRNIDPTNTITTGDFFHLPRSRNYFL